MDWHSLTAGFKAYLTLEKGLSSNSIAAYLRDIAKLENYSENYLKSKNPANVTPEEIEGFIATLSEMGMSPYSVSRIVSGLKAFYKYLIIENLIKISPLTFIKGPRITRKLPDVLSLEEIDLLISVIDHSTDQGLRNRAIIETLYACGLRVSELCDLKLSNIYFEDNFIRVYGKGNKERLVPIGDVALKHIGFYIKHVREQLKKIDREDRDHLFLSRRGQKLSRITIFNIIKDLTEKAGIDKTVSPHSFRHSFATHLIEGGADLRAVQEMLGHASIITTEIYTHLNTEFLRKTLMQYHPGYRGSQ